jgi:glycerate kinase
MKVVAAIDSYKGSVSSQEAGEAAKKGVLNVYKDAEVKVMTLADGGEGTVEALVDGMNGEYERAEVTGPLGERVESTYGMIPQKSLAVIEMAAAAGLPLVPMEKRNPLLTTSYGVGQLIRHAMEKGCRKFIIGIGGSATNDGGVGMLQALGFSFKDKNGKEIGFGGEKLMDIEIIDPSGADPLLKECEFNIACDVNNPLCGDIGASAIYGPQKGATPEMIEFLDKALGKFAAATKKYMGNDFADYPGSGAAGGMGFGFLSYLNVSLRPGIEIVLDTLDMDSALEGADILITGEGRIDRQTAMGKAPAGAAARAKKYGLKVIGIAGCTTDDAYLCNDKGIDAIFDVTDRAMTIEEAMDKENTKKNIEKTVTQIFNLIKTFS